MRVLVTGGAGYIGSHTAKALMRAGFEPVTFDNLSEGHEWAVKWGPFVRGDLADRSAIASALAVHGVGAVIHFAANAYVGESLQVPRKYFQNNVVNTLNLLGAMLDAQVSLVVFSSTCATYGEPSRVPIDEAHPQSPVSPYGESKLFVEKILRRYEQAYGMTWVALRYFNAAGADPDLEIGEQHDPETHIIPLAIQTALRVRPYLDIYGSDYDTPDGTAIRDYVHVADLADAHVKALQHLLDRRGSGGFNLGSGAGSSVLEIVSAVERTAQQPIEVRYVPRRVGDPSALWADISLATNVLGWTPRHSSLDVVVETAWQWQTKMLRSQKALKATP